jgi:cytoskeletal protein CcmA (bactofilin family)
MALQSRTYRAGSMRRREFTHHAHVHISGNAEVGTLFVAGDLTVEGKLVAERLVCLGKLTVGGSLRVGTALLGPCAEVAGAIQAGEMEVGMALGAIGSTLLGIASQEQARAALARRIHPRVIAGNENLAQGVAQGKVAALEAASLSGGRIRLRGAFSVRGTVEVDSFEASLPA